MAEWPDQLVPTLLLTMLNMFVVLSAAALAQAREDIGLARA
ncbi:hypothetical protein [Streptomyces lunaelactis]|nr:hypothetical protein [Streptomyces lunaelactis]